MLDGHALTRLVLGGAEEGSVLRHAGVGDEDLTPVPRLPSNNFGQNNFSPLSFNNTNH